MFDAPDVEKHAPEAKYTDSITKYVVTYVCILLLAGLQFLIARQNISMTGMVARMLFVAIAEAGLAIMFFMHLWAEKRGFLLFIVLITGFVLITMQNSWTDSFRIRYGVPGGHPNTSTTP
jgi:heme/copper-type cytochrome/quinol oxidase subunit 4